MAKTRTVIQIFLASPSDVTEERGVVQDVVAELNRTVARELGVVVELVRWEEVVPGMGRPEQVILDEAQIEQTVPRRPERGRVPGPGGQRLRVDVRLGRGPSVQRGAELREGQPGGLLQPDGRGPRRLAFRVRPARPEDARRRLPLRLDPAGDPA